MNTDPIADYLTRIRNAVRANHRVVEIPASNLKEISNSFDQGYLIGLMILPIQVLKSLKTLRLGGISYKRI